MSKSFSSYVLRLHRVLGAWTSLLLVMWFLSGCFITFCPYPSYNPTEEMSHRPRLNLSELVVDSTALSQAWTIEGGVRHVVLRGNALCSAYLSSQNWDDRELRWDLRGHKLDPQCPSLQDLALICRPLECGHIVGIDTIVDLDQWTPFAKLRPELPFYKVHLSGANAPEVYISSRDGHIITEHTRLERIGAWVGPIPHWVYPTWLRQRAELWRGVVIVLSGLSLFMALTGFYIGIRAYRARRKGGRSISPYRRRSYRWHHISGTVGGVMMLTWLASGLMSVVKVSPSLTGGSLPVGAEQLSGQTLPYERYRLQLSDIVKVCQGLDCRGVVWTSLGSHPLLAVQLGSGERVVYDALSQEPRPLSLDMSTAEHLVAQAYGGRYACKGVPVLGYDGYYRDRESAAGGCGATVYRIVVDGPGRPYVYVDSKTGKAQVLERHDRVRMWVYSKLHGLHLGYLEEHPWARYSLIAVGLVLGLVVSLTGLRLAVGYFVRRYRSR